MCNFISAHGRRLLSMSVRVHPNPTNSHSGMITDRCQMSHTHPEGCAPVDHHTAVAFEVPASLLLSPTLEADSEIYVTLLLTWPDITPSKFIHSSGLNLNRELLRCDVHRASLDWTTAFFHWGVEYLGFFITVSACDSLCSICTWGWEMLTYSVFCIFAFTLGGYGTQSLNEPCMNTSRFLDVNCVVSSQVCRRPSSSASTSRPGRQQTRACVWAPDGHRNSSRTAKLSPAHQGTVNLTNRPTSLSFRHRLRQFVHRID